MQLLTEIVYYQKYIKKQWKGKFLEVDFDVLSFQKVKRVCLSFSSLHWVLSCTVFKFGQTAVSDSCCLKNSSGRSKTWNNLNAHWPNDEIYDKTSARGDFSRIILKINLRTTHRGWPWVFNCNITSWQNKEPYRNNRNLDAQ